MLRVACVQMNSGTVLEDNLQQAEAYIREAAGQEARFISTPENTCLIRFPSQKSVERVLSQDEHPGVRCFAALAAELNITLHIGSLVVRINEDKCANRSFLFGPDGKIISTYDKIHLLDVEIPGGESHRESARFDPGSRLVVSEVEDVKYGLTICYDVRFPHLYRKLAQKGADILLAPAAFMYKTGEVHWEVLLRARAIETGSFVIAAAQTGEHENGRHTWGHSMIVGPWGQVLAEMGREPGILCVDIDLDEVKKARQTITAIYNDREFEG